MSTVKFHRKRVFAALIAIFIASFIVSCALGRFGISPIAVVTLFFSRLLPLKADWSPEAETVLFRIRLPRVVAAALVGAALSAAGAAYQGLFRNPLVSPDILGVSAGSGFGAALAIFCSLGTLATNFSAFGFGVATALLVSFLARRFKGDATLALVLVGIIAGSLFSSATSFLKLVADPTNVLPAITYWLMGSLASVRGSDLLFAAPPILISLAVLYALRWRINTLTMGEDEARSLGTDVGLVRGLIVASATLATAASVAISGMQGNEAFTAGALAAGLKFYAGYPITPSTEVAELCSEELPKIGGTFVQMEDEIGSIAAIIGASLTGRKAMTATSGPGFSLMPPRAAWPTSPSPRRKRR